MSQTMGSQTTETQATEMQTTMNTDTMMQAIGYDRYGPPDVLEYRSTPRPSPKAGQVLVQVKAAGVNPLEWHMMTGVPRLVRLMGNGLLRPKNGRLGLDLAGVVVAIGEGVTNHKVGDEVYGAARGAYAEYAVTEADRVNPLPEGMTLEQGGGVAVAAITALQGLRDKIDLQPGQHVVINGASGGVGTFAVQIAKLMGAEVTGVCSGRNVELVRSLGADHVIDYTNENFTEGTTKYDAIFDNVGSHSISHYRRVMKPQAVLLPVGGNKEALLGPIPGMLKTLVHSKLISQSIKFFVADENAADLAVLHGYFSQGQLSTVIDRTYPLEEAAEAMRYLDTHRARGKIVLTTS